MINNLYDDVTFRVTPKVTLHKTLKGIKCNVLKY